MSAGRSELLVKIKVYERKIKDAKERLATLDRSAPPDRWTGPAIPIVHEKSGRRFNSATEAAIAEGVDRTTILKRCDIGKDGWRRDKRPEKPNACRRRPVNSGTITPPGSETGGPIQ